MVEFGGEPASKPREVKVSDTNRENLETMLADKLNIIKAYLQPSDETKALGDIGLKVQLEDMIRDESGHAEEVLRILLDREL
ncbi:MAG: hypothetical protein VYA69_04900 [Gemmatimonadota bacterium]|nr:hypothetical protein [Gemmatimonadota bacterium]